jgi:putative N6-adenine-specific DNA methylase
MPLSKPELSCFAVTAPGLEELAAGELAALGVRGAVSAGGVAWKGTIESVAVANLHLRTASRVLVRIAEFHAAAFFELELHAKRIAWERFVAPAAVVEFRVTCRKSKLYHSGAVAQRLAAAIARRVPGVRVAAARGVHDEDDGGNASDDGPLFVVRFFHDRCVISVDSSGLLLHLRGYRQRLAKAPLRETLAAAILLGAGWKGDTPLADPMCGSGTIPIEAARLARRIAPGRDRRFAFFGWPDFDAAIWAGLLDDARDAERPSTAIAIAGSDRDAGAIAAARANAELAGVGADIDFRVQPISALAPAPPPGLIASNPPYGVRIGETDRLRNLYAQLGNVVRSRRAGWTVALLSADRKLEGQARLDFEERLRTRNGGIPVRLVVAHAPAG